MKTLLHITDLHFNKDFFTWIEQQQNKHEIFCITDDFIDSQHDNFAEQIQWIKQWLNQFNQPLFICSGNHDIEYFAEDDWFNHLENPLIFSDESIISIHGVCIGCYPYIGGMGYEEYSACDILLNHIPPAKTLIAMTSNNEDWGDIELYQALNSQLIAPKYVLSGHVHRPQANDDRIRNTLLINPGAGGKKTPKHRVISLS